VTVVLLTWETLQVQMREREFPPCSKVMQRVPDQESVRDHLKVRNFQGIFVKEEQLFA